MTRLKPFSFLILLAVAACTLATPAHAQSSRLYFAGYLGLNTYSDLDYSDTTSGTAGHMQMKNAVSLAGALGLRLTEQLRLEGEISRRKADLDRITINNLGEFEMDGEVASWLYLANFYYDLYQWQWRHLLPYVSVGVGAVHHEGDLSDSSGFASDAADSSVGLAWQVGGGLKYRLDPDLAISGGYRYIGAADLEFDGYEMEYGGHEFRIGLEYDIPVDMIPDQPPF